MPNPSKPGKCGTFRSRIGGSVTHNVGVLGLVFACADAAFATAATCARYVLPWAIANRRTAVKSFRSFSGSRLRSSITSSRVVSSNPRT